MPPILPPAPRPPAPPDGRLPIQVRPAANEPRLGVRKLRQFDLQVAFVSAGAIGEDVQDQFRARHHPAAQAFFEIALLGWRELVIEDHNAAFGALDGGFQFLDFAAAHEPARMRLVANGRSVAATTNAAERMSSRNSSRWSSPSSQ